MCGIGEHPSDYLITTLYDDGKEIILPYCRNATKSYLSAQAKYGAPFDADVLRVTIDRRGGDN